ncbi:MAG TPA: hypothetical protein VGL98_16170 [Gammaproteobacteria bacterium]
MLRHRKVSVGPVAAALAVALGVVGSSESQVEGGSAAAARQWRTPWGHPDLQGTWSSDDVRGIPLQRPEELGTRAEQTDEEFAERQRGNDQQVARLREGGTAFLAERGVRSFRQTSLVVDPPNGRMPPLTAEGQKRTDETQARRRSRPSSWEDRSLYDRCLTRGPVGSILPVIYGNGLEIHQTPNEVVIRYEMIHETRIIPIDDPRPRLGEAIKMYMGDARGRFEGETLVVETQNLIGKTAIGNNGNGTPLTPSARLVERFTRVADDQIDYSVTVTDPETYTAPFTIAFPITPQPDYQVLPYECHEGNMALANILSAARAEDRAIAEARAKGLPEPKFNNDDGPIFAPARE